MASQTSQETKEIYDQISSKYDLVQFHPCYRYINTPTFLKHFDNALQRLSTSTPKKIKLLNLACGSGRDTFSLWNQFQSQLEMILSVDLSPEMINIANLKKQQRMEKENGSHLPIHFVVGDVLELDKNEQVAQCFTDFSFSHNSPFSSNSLPKDPAEASSNEQLFDLVSACFLLHYSSSVEELETMCQQISRVLKPGGSFVTLNTDPFLNQAFVSEKQQTFGCFRSQFPTAEKEGRSVMKDGDRFEFSIDLNFNEDNKHEDYVVKFYNHHFNAETYEKALKKAGFHTVKFHPMEMIGQPQNTNLKDFGKYLEHNGVICIEALK
ncbi:hypothetical protein C9374_012905 [Naegleria lovaniensis]|uniref:Methyltransferase domain-containing protein n=1 Tax=Naegleria lovaniensis TaxID=51637 RepID=A0AA88GC67_NAELO|nr:uncharacterized protein C9374_012905 [Naegleria lovaniensis]KAG2373059.1 hypothetical protein C9374_012905 [Naegleria lovaniensis]